MVLGIDVGGTTVKYGVVTESGDILDKQAFDTHAWEDSAISFVTNLTDRIKQYQEKYDIKGIGIGLPGLLSQDRRSTHSLANIPVLSNQPILDMIENQVPNTSIKIENDAKCAALGEMYFGDNADCGDYLFIAMGTGVGGGYVIDGELFIGSNGNGTEIGHIPLKDGITLEDRIGQEKITARAYEALKSSKYAASILQERKLSPKVIYDAAVAGDFCAKVIFEEVGNYIGETLVGIIRFADVHRFILGGGVAGAFEFIKPALERYIKKELPSYYTHDLEIRKASLDAESGILGAASLVMSELK